MPLTSACTNQYHGYDDGLIMNFPGISKSYGSIDRICTRSCKPWFTKTPKVPKTGSREWDHPDLNRGGGHPRPEGYQATPWSRI